MYVRNLYGAVVAVRKRGSRTSLFDLWWLTTTHRTIIWNSPHSRRCVTYSWRVMRSIFHIQILIHYIVKTAILINAPIVCTASALNYACATHYFFFFFFFPSIFVRTFYSPLTPFRSSPIYLRIFHSFPRSFVGKLRSFAILIALRGQTRITRLPSKPGR